MTSHNGTCFSALDPKCDSAVVVEMPSSRKGAGHPKRSHAYIPFVSERLDGSLRISSLPGTLSVPMSVSSNGTTASKSQPLDEEQEETPME